MIRNMRKYHIPLIIHAYYLEQIIQIELDEKEDEQLQESIRVLSQVLDECM